MTRLDRPDLLLIRGGRLGTRVLLVPVTEVRDVLPRQERLILGRAPERERHKPIQRLRAFLAATFGIR